MPTVVIRTNVAQLTPVTIGDIGIIVPAAGGSDTFTSLNNLQRISLSQDLRNFATDNAFGLNNSTLIISNGIADVAQIDVNSFLDNTTIIEPFSLSIGGVLSSVTLPQSSLGIEIMNKNAILTIFQARRAVPGTSGTTTIQLEVNGILVGTALSWTPVDLAFSLKTTTISVPVSAGDALSFRLISAEVDAEDVYMVVY